MMMNNNEQKSILEVFGSKSQDGDKVKGLLLNALMGNSYENGGQVEEDSGFFGNIMGMFKDFGTKRKIKKSGKEFDRLAEEYESAEGTLNNFLEQHGIIESWKNKEGKWNTTFSESKLREKAKNKPWADIYSQLYNEKYEAQGRMEQGRDEYDALQKLLENN